MSEEFEIHNETTYEEALDQLSPVEQRFVVAYLEKPNIKLAAVKAGVPVTSARWQGSEMIKRQAVRLAIILGHKELMKRHQIEIDRVVEELKIIGHSSILDYKFDDDGNPVVEEGKEHLWRAVQSYEVTRIPQKHGLPPILRVRIKLWDKLGSVSRLGQIAGLWDGIGDDARALLPTIEVSGLDANRMLALPSKPIIIDQPAKEEDLSTETPSGEEPQEAS